MEENSHRKPQLTLPNQALEPIHNEGLYEIVKKKNIHPNCRILQFKSIW